MVKMAELNATPLPGIARTVVSRFLICAQVLAG